jgi:hypothetical protein
MQFTRSVAIERSRLENQGFGTGAIPKIWQEFETIVRDAQAQRWKSTTLQKNGRHGQKQHGVDIFGPDEIGRPVGIQCKRYKAALTMKTVTEEITNAENFKPRLSALFIATTTDHDAKLQEQVREISDKRVAEGKFAVALLFWDEIVSSLLLNPAVLKAHYTQLQLATTNIVDKERSVAALELGYYGSDLWAYILLVYGEFGQMAQEDPDKFIALLRVIERRVQQLLPPADAAPILDSLVEVRNGCLTLKKSESDWDPVEAHAKRVSSRLWSASSLIPFTESNVLDLGLQLGRIYHHTDDLPVPSLQSEVEQKVRGVLPQSSNTALRTAFSSARRTTMAHKWAQRIFALIDRELRFTN